MRIDLTGAADVAGLEAGKGMGTRPVAASGASSAYGVPEDRASLSPQSLQAPSLASQALASAEARVAKVQALRQAVTSAAYNVDPGLIADAIIGEGA